MSVQVNPERVEDEIRRVSDEISISVAVCDQTYRAFLAADRAYDAAFARAYMAHEGAAHERKFAAELATGGQRETRDAADAAYRYADRRAKALQDELRALQSVGASIRAMFAVAGTGER